MTLHEKAERESDKVAQDQSTRVKRTTTTISSSGSNSSSSEKKANKAQEEVKTKLS